MKTYTENKITRLRNNLLLCGFGIVMSLGTAYAQEADIDEAEPETESYMLLNGGSSIGFLANRPALNASLDQVFAKGFSLGLGVTYTNFGGNSTTGLLSRTNIGLRALYQFDKNPYFQVYTGLRAGASIWSGSASISGPWQITSYTGGDVIPTVQALFGIRYMPVKWLGIHTELALGAPYTIAAGVSINLTNATGGVEDIHQAEILVSERKNIVKLNISTAVGIPGVSYERYLFNRFSVEVGGSGAFYSASLPQASSYTAVTGQFSESDSLRQKIHAYGIVKMYLTATRKAIPQGLYMGGGYYYLNQKTLMKVEDLRPVPDVISYDYEKQSEMHSGVLVMGYQQVFGKRFIIDAFAGLRLGTSELLWVKYKDANASEEKFGTNFGAHQEPLKTNFNPVFLKISMGFML